MITWNEIDDSIITKRENVFLSIEDLKGLFDSNFFMYCMESTETNWEDLAIYGFPLIQKNSGYVIFVKCSYCGATDGEMDSRNMCGHCGGAVEDANTNSR